MFSFSILFFTACNEDEEYKVNEKELGSSTNTKAAGEKYQVLGYGYDITSDIFSHEAVKYQVVDIKSLLEKESANPSVYFRIEAVNQIYSRSFSGENLSRYMEHIITKSGFNGSVASRVGEDAKIKETSEKYFSATANFNKEKETKYTYSSMYSFATTDVYKELDNLNLHANVDIAAKYLTSNFKYQLDNLTPVKADYIVKYYGTHVMFNITVGGYYRSNFKTTITEETNYSRKRELVDASAKYNLVSVGLGAAASWDKTTITEAYNKITNKEGSMYALGGSSNGLTISFDNNGNVNHNVGYGTWTGSITEKTAKLVKLNWDLTYPIYDLVSDTQKKQLLKDAVKRYIDSKKIEIKEPDIYPLYLYRAGSKDYYLDTRLNPSGWGTTYGVVCYILKSNDGDAVPLYQYKAGKGFYYDTRLNPSGWGSAQGVVCYVYKEQMPGTVPLYQYKAKDGYYYDTRLNPENWGPTHGIVCYVYPQNTPIKK